jgi:hypothetical protein
MLSVKAKNLQELVDNKLIISTLQQPPESRLPDDIRRLKNMIAKLGFFKEKGDDEIQFSSEHLRHETLKQNETLMHYGD